METKRLKLFTRLGAIIALSAILLLVISASNSLFAQGLDMLSPSSVSGVTAAPGDSSITLSWDAATDNVGVTDYKINYGMLSGQYTMPPIFTGDVLEYTVTGLSNGTTYFFAISAVDEAGHESEEYSYEVTATPSNGETLSGDTTPPTVVNALAIGPSKVMVTFSEDIQLPENSFTAVTIAEAESAELVNLIDVTVSETDPSIVIVDTGTLTDGLSYAFTASSSIQDLEGNAVSSGTSDSAFFTGTSQVLSSETIASSLQESAVPEDEGDDEPLQIDTVDVLDLKSIDLYFSESVVLPELTDEESEANPMFVIHMDGNEADALTIHSAIPDVLDNSLVHIATEEEMTINTTYVLLVDHVEDGDGNAINEEIYGRVQFQSSEPVDGDDVTPPADITELEASVQEDRTIDLTWVASINTDNDLDEYMLFSSTDDGATYTDGVSISASSTSYTVEDLEMGSTYTFKIAALDNSGNESDGVVTTIALPETGPEMALLLLIPALFGGMYLARRKEY